MNRSTGLGLAAVAAAVAAGGFLRWQITRTTEEVAHSIGVQESLRSAGPVVKPKEVPLKVTPDPRPAPTGPEAPEPSMSNEAIVFHAKVASTKVTVDLTNARPVDILDAIASSSGIPIEIDRDAAVALAAAERTSISLKDLPMTMALQMVLSPAHVHAEIGECSIVVKNH